MSFQDNLNQHLRLRPYIQFDKDDYMMKLFHFDGTTVIYNDGDVYKHRYMYVYDVESKSFIWTDDLREYVIQNFGDLIYKPLYVRRMTFDEVAFKVIIVDVYDENYMVVNSHAVSGIYYKSQSKEPVFQYKPTSTNILFYDSLSVKQQLKRNGRWIDVVISEPLDFCDGSLFDTMPEFNLVSAFKQEQGSANVVGELSYSQILDKSTRLEVLEDKFKTLNDIKQYINIDLLTYWEIGIFRQLHNKLTDAEFNLVYIWYLNGGRELCDLYFKLFAKNSKREWSDIYEVYIGDYYGIKMHDMSSFDDQLVIADFIPTYKLAYGSKSRLELDKSVNDWESFVKYNQDLDIIANNNHVNRRLRSCKISLNGFRPLLRQLEASALDVKILKSVGAITRYGSENHIDVSDIILDVVHGKTVLVAYIDGNNNYLVSIVKNDTKYQIEDVMLLNQYKDIIEVQDLADVLM